MEILLFIAIFALIGLYALISKKIRLARFYKKNTVCPQCSVSLVKTNVAVYDGASPFGNNERRDGARPNTQGLRCPNCDYKIALRR